MTHVQIREIAARLCWTHPGYGEFISKKDASDALHQYADEMEADTVSAAAPELLDAARRCVSRMEEVADDLYEGRVDRVGVVVGALRLEADRASAAIAKAEGSAD